MKFTLKLAAILGLLILIVIIPFADFTAANPYIDWGTIDGIGIDFIVTLTSPTNSSLYTTDNVPLIFTAGIQNLNPNLKITNVEFVGDWLNGTINLNQNITHGNAPNGRWGTFIHCNIILQGVPEGNHTLTVRAYEDGFYIDRQIFITHVNGNQNLTSNFLVDRPPTISFLNPQNQTYETSNLTLSVTTNKSLSNITYSLDNQKNVTNNNNHAIAISNLINGMHNITAYAQDALGVTSAPATIIFTIKTPTQEPFLTASTLTAILITLLVLIVATGLLIYLKKHRRSRNP